MIAAAIVSLAVSLLLQPLIRRFLLRYDFVDHPSHRSSHAVPTPRGGGIAIVLAVFIGLLIGDVSLASLIAQAFVIVVLFALMGLLDDRMGLSARVRLLSQLVLAAGVVSLMWVRPGAPDSLSWLPEGVFATVGVFWIVAYTNAFNFMDGINGISALNAFLASAYFAWLGALRDMQEVTVFGIAIAASCLGFLPWNAPRARLFLGDVGSYCLGSGIAVMALWLLWRGTPLLLCVAPLVVYLADTGAALLRRVKGRRSWREAHREHVYQRLTDGGWPHLATAIVTVLAAVCAVVVAQAGAPAGWLLIVGVCLGYLVLPVIASRLARTSSGMVRS